MDLVCLVSPNNSTYRQWIPSLSQLFVWSVPYLHQSDHSVLFTILWVVKWLDLIMYSWFEPVMLSAVTRHRAPIAEEKWKRNCLRPEGVINTSGAMIVKLKPFLLWEKNCMYSSVFVHTVNAVATWKQLHRYVPSPPPPPPLPQMHAYNSYE